MLLSNKSLLTFLSHPLAKHALFLGFLLSLFTYLTGWRLDLPGPHGDEVNEFGPALAWISGNYFVELIMGPYHGITESILALPFIAFLGKHYLTIRLFSFLTAAAAVVTFYFLLFKIYKKFWLAFCGALLWTVSPTFTIGTRAGTHYAIDMFFLFFLSLIFFIQWVETSRKPFLWTSCFFLGLTLGCRSWFMGVINALFLTLVLLRFDLIKKLWQPSWINDLVKAASIVFLVGLGPILFHNIVNEPVTLHFLRETYPESHTLPNYIDALGERLGQFKTFTLQTPWFHHMLADIEWPVPSNTYSFWMLIVSLGATVPLFFFSPRPLQKLSLAAPLVFLFYLLQLPLSSNMSNVHFMILFPVFPLIILQAFFMLDRLLESTKWRILPLLLFLLTFYPFAKKNFEIHTSFKQFVLEVGGGMEFSSALVDLARFSESKGLKYLYFPGSQGRILSAFQYLSPRIQTESLFLGQDFRDKVKSAQKNEGYISIVDKTFISFWDEDKSWRVGEALLEDVEEMRRLLEEKKSFRPYIFHRRDGVPFLKLYIKNPGET